MSTWNRGRARARRSSSLQPERDPLDRDYGYGYSEEGRPITGITGDDTFDPQAEIFDDKGETSYVNLEKKKAIRMCSPDQHDLKPDGEPGAEIPDHQAMSCSRCPYGQFVPVK